MKIFNCPECGFRFFRPTEKLPKEHWMAYGLPADGYHCRSCGLWHIIYWCESLESE
jgi:hypothetical protein